MNFEQAFRRVVLFEGGYSDHENDPGGKTNHGVTESVARAHGYVGDMRDLPLDIVRKIYRDSYWDATRCDDLPPALRLSVFDSAINSGPSQSVKWLQRAVDARDDGKIGPETISKARAFHPDLVKRRMLSQRLKFMTDLKTWPVFGRGWARRIADLLEA